MNGIILICGLGLVGLWLEGISGFKGINAEDGFLDRFFTADVLSGVGCIIAFVEGWVI